MTNFLINSDFIKNQIYIYYLEKESNEIFDSYSMYFNKINIESNNMLCNSTSIEKELFKNYFYFLKRSINDKKISIKIPNTNQIIYTDKYFIILEDSKLFGNKYKNSICNYYFEEEDIILGINLGTGGDPLHSRPMYLIMFKTNKIFLLYNYYENIDFSSNICNDNRIKKIIEYKNKIINTNFKNINSEIVTLYGFHNNIGHYIFNDITGLFILDNYDIVNKIDKVILGPNDVYNTKQYFLNKNINIEEKDNVNHLDGFIAKGIIFKYNHFHISDKCNNFFINKIINTLKPDINIDNFLKEKINYIKNNYYPVINIVLRCNTFFMENQDIVISEFINKILIKYPNSYFFIDGFCKSPKLNINLSYKNHSYTEISNDYLETFKNIELKINTKNYKSLLNYDSYTLIQYLKIANFSLYQLSSEGYISTWICKVPGIIFGRSHVKIYDNMDKVIRENSQKNYYITNVDSEEIKYYENSFSITSNLLFNLFNKYFYTNIWCKKYISTDNLNIIHAEYGIENYFINITNILRNKINNIKDDFYIIIDNNLTNIDPKPGVTKNMNMIFTYNNHNNIYCISLKENNLLFFSDTPFILSYNNIISALYGINNTFIDIKNIIYNKLKNLTYNDNDNYKIIITNDFCGQDPYPNKLKITKIYYKYKNKNYNIVIDENDIIYFYM